LNNVADLVAITPEEITLLGAEDSEFFNRHFFPRTFRQESPEFHRDVDALLDGPDRYVALKMFRGSAKTTKVRAFAAKRMSYGISRTIVFVGNAQKNSIYSLRWIRKQVMSNSPWASHFGLVPGSPWTDEHICIVHTKLGIEINVIALGVTSQIRGINLDDYRPDLIIPDDIDNEETTNTPEQREKTSDLLGSLEKALAPPTEDLHAKMVVLQTPINAFDYITTISKSDKWKCVTFSCFDDAGKSRWEARLPTAFLEREKREHIQLNKLHLWLREMECKIVNKESASFRFDWLRYWTELPKGLDVILAIDPASSEAKDADDQVLGAVGFAGRDLYLIAYTAEKGEMPDRLSNTFFNYIRDFGPRKAAVETVAYQRILKWYLEEQMRKQRIFLLVEAVDDKRKKSDRILQALLEPAAHGHLYVHASHTKFIEQFSEYSPFSRGHDDVLDMVAIAVASRRSGTGTTYEGEYDRILDGERMIPDLEEWRVAI
jgi:hypothetical protein